MVTHTVRLWLDLDAEATELYLPYDGWGVRA